MDTMIARFSILVLGAGVAQEVSYIIWSRGYGVDW